MSDEQTPPPPALRLKPRLRPDAPAAGVEGAPSAPAPEAATPPAEATPATPGKIRFKPRLNAEAAPAPAPAEPVAPVAPPEPTPPPAAILPEPAPSPVIPPLPAPPAPAAAPAADAAGGPRVKLKARISSPPPAIPTASPAAPAAPAPVQAVIPAIIPATPPPAIAPEPPAAVIPPAPEAEAPAAESAEPAKFKLKPKGGAAPAMIGGIPIAAPPPAPAGDGKAPPPFPVVAPAGKSGKTTPSIPHVVVKAEVTEPEAPVRLPLGGKAKAKRGKRLAILGGVAVVVLGTAGFFAYKIYLGEEPPPPPVTKKVAPKAAPATAATPPADATKAPAGGPTPSETLNNIAKAPAQIVNNAKTTINNAAQGRQSALEDAAGDPASQGAKANAPATNTATAVRGVAPGLSATTEVQAASEASVAFRAYVANVKIGGVVVTRAIINNKLTRAGETVDNALGITFEGYDPDSKLLTFRDRSGAVVSRKYP